MPSTYGPAAYPYPQPTDAPDGPGAFLALVQKMSIDQDTLVHLQAIPGAFVNQRGSVNNDPSPANNGSYLWSGSAWVFFAPFVAPLARVTRSGAFNTSATPSAYLSIPWDADIINVGPVPPHSTSTNPSRLIAQIPGMYRIKGNARINTTTGSGNGQIAKNGVAIADTLFSVTPVSGTTPFVFAEDTVQMAAGDYLEFQVASSVATVAVSNAACSFAFIHP